MPQISSGAVLCTQGSKTIKAYVFEMNTNCQYRHRAGHTTDPQPSFGLQPLEPRQLLSGTLDAEFVWVDNTAELTGFTTADLQVTTTSDWTAVALLLELTQGSIYQDAVGSNTQPSSAVINAFPSVEFDTYVASNGNSTIIAGGAGDVGGDGLQFDTSELDISWIDTATNDIGTINIGRFSLSDDAVGTWSLRLLNADGDIFTMINVAFTDGELATPPPPPPALVDGDFTGDGKADIFWHNTHNGRNALWQMDGTNFASETAGKRLKNTDWKLVGTADLTGDDNTDLLWHNTRDGRNTVWEMSGTTFIKATAIKKLGNMDWRVGGIGDFTGDGKDDIFWHNTKDGRNVVWEMDGTTFQGGVVLMTLSNLRWEAAAVGDMTGDGKDDILWRHSRNGRNTLWEMDGSTFQNAIPLMRVRNLNWQIAGLADYTGDGKKDILWRKTDTGKNTVWEMNDTAFQSPIALLAEPDLDEQPASPLLGLWEG